MVIAAASNTDMVAEVWIPLLRGALWTVILTVVGGLLGTIVGVIVGLIRTSGSQVANFAGAVYTNFIRGVPLLIILFFVYFALPLLIPGALVPAFATALIALTIYVGAYMAEVVRGSILAVPRGQTEAAQALGMGYWVTLRNIILPQALKTMIPPGIGVLLSLVKDTSLVSVIGFVELTKAGRIVSIATSDPILIFVIVGGIYFAICYPISVAGSRLERRLDPRTRRILEAVVAVEPRPIDNASAISQSK